MLSVPEIAASPNPAGAIANDYDSPIPPSYGLNPAGAISKRKSMTQEWVAKAIRDKSPSQALMRMEEEEMDQRIRETNAMVGEKQRQNEEMRKTLAETQRNFEIARKGKAEEKRRNKI